MGMLVDWDLAWAGCSVGAESGARSRELCIAPMATAGGGGGGGGAWRMSCGLTKWISCCAGGRGSWVVGSNGSGAGGCDSGTHGLGSNADCRGDCCAGDRSSGCGLGC